MSWLFVLSESQCIDLSSVVNTAWAPPTIFSEHRLCAGYLNIQHFLDSVSDVKYPEEGGGMDTYCLHYFHFYFSCEGQGLF